MIETLYGQKWRLKHSFVERRKSNTKGKLFLIPSATIRRAIGPRTRSKATRVSGPSIFATTACSSLTTTRPWRQKWIHTFRELSVSQAPSRLTSRAALRARSEVRGPLSVEHGVRVNCKLIFDWHGKYLENVFLNMERHNMKSFSQLNFAYSIVFKYDLVWLKISHLPWHVIHPILIGIFPNLYNQFDDSLE